MLTENLARVPIAFLPTPVVEMRRLSEAVGGLRILAKRDDQTGLAMGGNKARKLEFLIADALARGADTVLTVGGPQSNHVRQTAAAANMYGLRSVLILRGTSPFQWDGNLLLDDLLGAEVRWAGDRPLEEAMSDVASEEESTGHRPYAIPLGGSTPVGAAGYVAAMEELMGQLEGLRTPVDAIVLPTGSAGTQAGIVVGAKALGFEGQVVGISVSAEADAVRRLLGELAPATAQSLGLDIQFDDRDFIVYDDYLGGGYGVLGAPEREAIRVVARLEGVLLDPVYTGRAMAGLLDLSSKGVFQSGQTILFWHTGGTAALFAYGEGLTQGAG
ncbi:MAG TPA: D-cysteine desulfhydrase family protein [Anaerolineae bacterium]|nr:D-cysteine desulfhydrase family protein [Anaerolineae bacterium]